MLEAARTFIANADIRLTAPIIFLFNGAEETLSQAAHGFMAHDRYGRNVVALYVRSRQTAQPGQVLWYTSY